MTEKIIFSAIFFTWVFVSTIFGQNAAQIKEKYGQSLDAYSVSEHIWMTPEYASDGQVCQIRLYPKRISATTNYLSHKLVRWELKKALEDLAPLEVRGKRTDFFGSTLLLGQMSDTKYNYEKVNFSFLASWSFDTPEIKAPKPATPARELPKQTVSDNEMNVPYDSEIATISWNQRICAKK